MMIDRTEQRTLQDVEFLDPAKVLMDLGRHQIHLAASDVDDRVRRLRTNRHKKLREIWHGALLTYTWSRSWGKALLYAHHERQDYDIIVRSDTDRALIKVQLKELPPKTLNPSISLQTIVEKCRSNRSYDLNGTEVAIYVNNENGRLEREDIPPQGEPPIWLFGFSAPGQSRIFAGGYISNDPGYWEVDHPFFGKVAD